MSGVKNVLRGWGTSRLCKRNSCPSDDQILVTITYVDNKHFATGRERKRMERESMSKRFMGMEEQSKDQETIEEGLFDDLAADLAQLKSKSDDKPRLQP